MAVKTVCVSRVCPALQLVSVDSQVSPRERWSCRKSQKALFTENTIMRGHWELQPGLLGNECGSVGTVVAAPAASVALTSVNNFGCCQKLCIGITEPTPEQSGS